MNGKTCSAVEFFERTNFESFISSLFSNWLDLNSLDFRSFGSLGIAS
jgi:hypothetical protein